ncbi:MAG: CRISPR-associated helicase Cas3' [Crenarchaeota archaeon]|nr:CRISPR-associated helicase Cas3' [Thermoproteota archaeon]
MKPPWERPGVEELAQLTRRGENTVFIAPTGYGKSKSTHRLLAIAEQEHVAVRAVHVLPLRALVEELYNYYTGLLGDAAGYLAGIHHLPRSGYSGLMLRRLTVSTIDSFSLNLAKVPVTELRMVREGLMEGHYELPRTAILTSLVVLDETHLYAEPWTNKPQPPLGRIFLEAAAETLAEMHTPLVLETATLPVNYTKKLAKISKARILAVCRSCGDNTYTRIHDKEYEETHTHQWRTRLAKGGLPEATKKAREEAEKGRKVLLAVNTVKDALQAHSLLLDMGQKPVLIHGRLSARDRMEAVRKIREAEIIIATQVIEAGVDVDAEALVTAAAPPSTLAQRAGRLCRSEKTIEKCSEEPPTITIYTPSQPHPYPQRTIQKTIHLITHILTGGKEIEWRLLDDRPGYKTYTHLIDAAEQPTYHRPPGEVTAYKILLRYTLQNPLIGHKYTDTLLERYCSLVRGTTLVALAIPRGKDYDHLEAPLDWLKHHPEILECRQGRCKIIAIHYTDTGEEAEEEWIDAQTVSRMLTSCKTYQETLARIASKTKTRNIHDIHLAVKEEAYKPGIGLTP